MTPLVADLAHVPPTDRQQDILQHIKKFAIANECWPGLRELARDIGRSLPCALGYVVALERRGLIVRDAGRKRHAVKLKGFKLALVEDRIKPPSVGPFVPRLGDPV